MNALKAVEAILKEAGKPLSYQDITQRMLAQGLWQTKGETPEATINARLAVNIKMHGMHSLFQRTDRGVFALRAWGLPEYHAIVKDKDDASDNNTPTSAPLSDIKTTLSNVKTLSFTDATEEILQRFGDNKPMHYREITQKAMALGLLKTAGLTPEATLYSQILVTTQEN